LVSVSAFKDSDWSVVLFVGIRNSLAIVGQDTSSERLEEFMMNEFEMILESCPDIGQVFKNQSSSTVESTMTLRHKAYVEWKRRDFYKFGQSLAQLLKRMSKEDSIPSIGHQLTTSTDCYVILPVQIALFLLLCVMALLSSVIYKIGIDPVRGKFFKFVPSPFSAPPQRLIYIVSVASLVRSFHI